MADLKAAAKHFKIPYEDASDFLKNAPMFHVLAAQALEAWAWQQEKGAKVRRNPVDENGRTWNWACDTLSDKPVTTYYADTPLGAVLAAMEGEKNG